MKGFTQNKRTALLFGLSALFALGSVAAVTTATVNNGFSLTGITAAAESRVTYRTVSAVLSDAIGVRFYFNGLQQGDTATISCLNTTIEGVAYKTDANGDYFEYNGITAKMLQDYITVTVKGADNKEIATITKNATDYLITASGTDWSALKHANGTMNNVLVSDVLKYGAAAEIYTDHNANNAIKTYMADYSFAFDANEVAVRRDGNAYKHGDTTVCALDGEASDVLSWGSVRLDLTNAIRIAFTYTVNAENAADYTMVVKNKVGEVVKTFTPQKGENEAFAPVYFSELCDGVYTATLQDAEGKPVGQAFTYSVMMYVNQHYKDGNDLADLVKSLWQAGKSAAIYKAGSAFNYIDDDLTKVVATNGTLGTLSYTVEATKLESTVGGQGTKECIGNSFGTHYTYVHNEKTYAPQKDEEGAVKIVSGIYYNNHFVSDYEMYTEGFNTDTEGVTYDQESNTYKVTAAPTKGTIVSIYNANVDVQADLKDLCVEAYKGTIGDVTISSGTVTKLTISGGNEDKTTHNLTNNGTITRMDLTSGNIYSTTKELKISETFNVSGGSLEVPFVTGWNNGLIVDPATITVPTLKITGGELNIGLNNTDKTVTCEGADNSGKIVSNMVDINGGTINLYGQMNTSNLITRGGTINLTIKGTDGTQQFGVYGTEDVQQHYYLLAGTLTFTNRSTGNGGAAISHGCNNAIYVLGGATVNVNNFIFLLHNNGGSSAEYGFDKSQVTLGDGVSYIWGNGGVDYWNTISGSDYWTKVFNGTATTIDNLKVGNYGDRLTMTIDYSNLTIA